LLSVTILATFALFFLYGHFLRPVLGDPVRLLAMVVVAYALLSLPLDALRRIEVDLNLCGRTLLPGRVREGARLALSAAATAIGEGEDPRAVAERLRLVPVEGRARLYRDVAVRCLEGAARYERVEGRLRREAAGWCKVAFKEMK